MDFRRVDPWRVLVLEDEPSLRRNLIRFLESRGVSVVGARTLKEARACLESAPVDAAVLDVSLPDGDGLDLLPLTSPASSLVVSAEAAAETLRERGVEHFQRKPLDLAAVAKTIEGFLAGEETVGATR